jgi:hypothetical protein
MNVRMIDCVGYILPSAIGYFENEAPRMVLTPWFEEEIPFNMAAEIGTQKVINEHSTIGVVITTDGSFTDIPREEYEESEERVIKELKTIKKPFIVVLNCRNPKSDESLELARRLSEKYMVPVVPQNCADMETEDINEILSAVLYTFPIKEVSFMMPGWINSLERSHWLRSEMYGKIGESILETNVISDINQIVDRLKGCDNISSAVVSEIDLGDEHHRELFSLIEAYTEEDEPITVYGNENAFYFYSQRVSASKYSFTYPIILMDEKIRNEYFQELHDTLPKLILVQTLWCNDEYIQEFLATHPYECITDFHDYGLYLRTTEPKEVLP